MTDQNKLYACKLCQSSFTSPHNLQLHIRNKHLDMLSSKGHSSSKWQVKLKNSQKSFPCSHCNYSCSRKADLSDHERTHLGIKPFSCECCDKSFTCQRYLNEHKKRMHRKDDKTESMKWHDDEYKKKLTNQKLPSKKFSSDQMSLDDQVELSNTKKRFPCSHCNYSTSKNAELVDHELRHLGIKSSVCQYCDKAYTCQRDLNLHKQRKHHYEYNVETKEKFESRIRPFSCNHCDKSYLQQGHLTEHMQKIHNDEYLMKKSMKKENAKKKSQCSTCGLEVVNIARHMMRHTKEFGCSICSKTFALQNELDVHMSRHTGEKTFVCDQCGKKFACQVYLKQHRLSHNTDQSVKCKICEKTFKSDRVLRVHMLWHSGQRLQCSICDKKFYRKGDLNIHFRTHTGEKPYVCVLCDHRFASNKALRRHSLTHTSAISAPFQCSTCGKKFQQSFNLKVHTKTHTGGNEYQWQSTRQDIAHWSNVEAHGASHDIYN